MEVKVGTRFRRTVEGINLIGIVTVVNGSTCWVRWHCPDETMHAIRDVQEWS